MRSALSSLDGGSMTLLIACLLIYHFDMEWWWYAIAGLVWLSHLKFWPNRKVIANKLLKP